MAYNSQINYADELKRMMSSGAVGVGDINRYLNERIEKMQASGQNAYDDVTKDALAYIIRQNQPENNQAARVANARKKITTHNGDGYNFKYSAPSDQYSNAGNLLASDNVDYASLINDILGADNTQDGYYENLAAALAMRGAKLPAGYDQYSGSGVSDGNGGTIAYNGPGSLEEQVNQYLINQKLQNASYPALTGGYVDPGITVGSIIAGQMDLADTLLKAGYGMADLAEYGLTEYVPESTLRQLGLSDGVYAPGTSMSGGGGGGGGRAAGGYTADDINTMRRAARDNVGNTNAITRAAVQGENSSLVKSATEAAYRDGLSALMQMGDTKGENALKADQSVYNGSTLVNKVGMPEEANDRYSQLTYGSGSGSRSAAPSGASADMGGMGGMSMEALRNNPTPIPYEPLGYDDWVADLFSSSIPGAVYDGQSKVRGSGDLYVAPPVTAIGGGTAKKPVEYATIKNQYGLVDQPRMVAYNDFYADLPYDQKQSVYVIGYGPANDADIAKLDKQGSLKAQFDEYGRESFYYDDPTRKAKSKYGLIQR